MPFRLLADNPALRTVIDTASEIFYQVAFTDDPFRGRVVFVSPQCETVTGHPPAAFMANPALWIDSIHPDDRPALAATTTTALTTKAAITRQYRIRAQSGEYRWMSDRVMPLFDADGAVNGYHGAALDMTAGVEAEHARQELERRLSHGQKMEALGRVAGGIAHDFNNLLTIIMGHCDAMLMDLEGDAPARKDAEAVIDASVRASALIDQLLAFARQQAIAPKVLDLNVELQSLRGMLQRLVGTHIGLTQHLSPGLWHVQVDPSQCVQVLINLAANARDAMPEGGSLAFATANVVVDRVPPEAGDAMPGDYVQLTVMDTGAGMDEATLVRVFEPFFTTKPEGDGTGLGLATVYGIVQQNGGFIDLTSAPGRGTSVRIHLPRHIPSA